MDGSGDRLILTSGPVNDPNASPEQGPPGPRDSTTPIDRPSCTDNGSYSPDRVGDRVAELGSGPGDRDSSPGRGYRGVDVYESSISGPGPGTSRELPETVSCRFPGNQPEREQRSVKPGCG